MNGLPIISSPWSEPWMAWTMLGLLILAYIAHAMQPQAIATAFRTFFTTGDRNSTFIDSDLDRRAQALMIFLAIFTFAMGAYVSLLAYLGTGQYSFRTYGFIVLVSVGLLTVRSLFEMLVAFTFVPRSSVHTLLYHYYHLTVCTAIIHYPIVLMSLYWSALTPRAIIILNAALLVLYLLGLFIKTCAVLMHSWRSLLYILLFVFTLELVPFMAVLGLAYQLITK